MPETETKEKAISVSQLGRLWGKGLDLPGDTSGKPTKPAAQVEWVYACLRAIITTCRNIQLVLSTTAEDIVESGPIYDLLLNNKEMPWMTFITETVGYLALHNEVYWISTDAEGIKPKKILVAGPNHCKPVIRSDQLVGYELQVSASKRIPLFVEDVYPVLDFNPYYRHRGLGPLDAAGLSVSSSYQATLFNESTLSNGARIGVVLITPQGVKLDQEEKDYLRAQFNAQQAGARNAGKAFLATGGMDVKPFTQTMADLQMIDLRRFDAASICAAFGVPPEIVGLNPEAQYAHGPAQQRFVQNTIDPMLSFVAGHLTLGLLSRFRFAKHVGTPFAKSVTFCGSRTPLRRRSCYRQERIKALQSGSQLFAWFDISQHPAMQQLQRTTAESVLKFTGSGVTLNNLIEAHDLPYETQPWGDHFWIGMGQVPASFILEAGTEGITGPSLPEGEQQSLFEPAQTKVADNEHVKADEQQRLRLWRNWVVSWAGIEREYTSAVRVFFVRQEKTLIAKLKKTLSELKSEKADVDEIVARVVFDLKLEDGKIRVINQAFFGKASELGIRQTLTEILSLSGDKLTAAAEQAKLMAFLKGKMIISTHKITGINQVTQKLVARQLREGLKAGEGLNELTGRIKRTLGSNRARAASIARTQTAGAVDSGRHAGMKYSGVELHGWVTSGDSEVRDAHVAAGTDYASGIPLEQPFDVIRRKQHVAVGHRHPWRIARRPALDHVVELRVHRRAIVADQKPRLYAGIGGDQASHEIGRRIVAARRAENNLAVWIAEPERRAERRFVVRLASADRANDDNPRGVVGSGDAT